MRRAPGRVSAPRPGRRRVGTRGDAEPPRARARSLAPYRAKRDFRASPEPMGTRAARAGRSFCVQQHLASSLHYDFRLEHRGTLLSWAVPKGPSLDAAVKRLAIAVEDHPVDYGSFEGVIAAGYGAGIVLLWDRGVWEPLDAEVDAALAKGHLRFALHGVKLHGVWQLVRTTRHGGKDWLLMKSDDAAARSGDSAERHRASVASGGGFADILAREPSDPWPRDPPVTGGETGRRFAEIIAQSRRKRRHGERQPNAPAPGGNRRARAALAVRSGAEASTIRPRPPPCA